MNFKSFCTKFFDIGSSRTNIISIKYGLNKKKKNLINKTNLKDSIEKFISINNEQKDVIFKYLSLHKKKLIDNNSYKGYRIVRGLPLNKQRTKTNSRTIRRILIR